MANNSKWYVAGVLLIGAVIGIVFVGILTSVVHWAGSPKFCGEFCHSMDLTYAAYKKGQHYMTGSGATAGCSDCHLKNESNHFAGPIDYTALLIDKAIAEAVENAKKDGIHGKATTPYLLAKIKDLTGGDSLDSNIQLVFNNARLGAAAAVELAKLER